MLYSYHHATSPFVQLSTTAAMAGIKHPRSDEDMETPAVSPFMPTFEIFRDELDEHQARRESIIKASRDITALSKKM